MTIPSAALLTWATQNGAGGILLVVLVVFVGALKTGLLRTQFEVDAWRGRAERAEEQVDQVLKSLDQVMPTLDRQMDLIQRLRR